MAAPTPVPPGIPDKTSIQGEQVYVNTEKWWTFEEPPPSGDYQCRFNNTTNTFATIPQGWQIQAGDVLEFDINLTALTTTSASLLIAQLSANFQITLRANSNRPRLTFKNVGGTQYNLDVSATMTPGAFQHVTYTFATNSITVDVDGDSNTITENPDYSLMLPVLLSSNNGGAGGAAVEGVIKNLTVMGATPHTWAINDGPGSTQFADTVGSLNMTQQNIVEGDWEEL